MSHNDYIEQAAPGFNIIAHTPNCPVAAAEDETRGLYCVQFHPEVLHTENGTKMLRNFVYNVCGCAGDLEDGLLCGDIASRPCARRSAMARCCALFPVVWIPAYVQPCWQRPLVSS